MKKKVCLHITFMYVWLSTRKLMSGNRREVYFTVDKQSGIKGAQSINIDRLLPIYSFPDSVHALLFHSVVKIPDSNILLLSN